MLETHATMFLEKCYEFTNLLYRGLKKGIHTAKRKTKLTLSEKLPPPIDGLVEVIILFAIRLI